MSKINKKILKLTSVISAWVVVLASLAFGFAGVSKVNVEAANKDAQIAQLLSAHDVFVYTTPYGNVPPSTSDAVAYYEFELKGADLFSPADPSQFLEIIKVQELYYVTPINPEDDFDYITNLTDYDFTTATTVRDIEYPDGSPAYFLRTNGSNENLALVLTPQRTVDGGCTAFDAGAGDYKGCNWDLDGAASWDPTVSPGTYTDPIPQPANYNVLSYSADAYNGPLGAPGGNYMGAYKIFVAIDPDIAPAATTAQFDDEITQLKFPDGYPGSEWPFGLQVNWDQAGDTDVLDPNSVATAQIVGNPQPGDTSYQVEISNLDSIAGSSLEAPNGYCTTVVNSTTYTGTGITGGVCTVTVNETISGDIADNTADVSDNGGVVGTPPDTVRVFEITGIPYTGINYLDSTDFPSAINNSPDGIVCTPAVVGGTSTCYFDLTDPTLVVPDGFKIGVNDADAGTNASVCTVADGAGAGGLDRVTCTDVPMGSEAGVDKPVHALFPDAPLVKEPTGNDIDVNARILTTPEIDDLGVITNMACVDSVSGGNPIAVSDTATCTFNLPSDITLPADFYLGIGDSAGVGSTACTATATPDEYECTNVPTGTEVGSTVPVYGQIGTEAKTDTTQTTPVDPKEITDPDLDDLTGFIDGEVTCLDPQVNSTDTCTFELYPQYTIPGDMRIGVGTNPNGAGPACTIVGTTVTCTQTPIGPDGGTQPVNAQIATDPVHDTQKTVDVNLRPLETSDIGDMTFSCDPTDQATTTCYVVLPENTELPPEGLTIGIAQDPGSADMGGTCTAVGSLVTCTDVPTTGATPGDNNIYAEIGTDPITDTDEDVFILPPNQSANDVAKGVFEFSPNRANAPLFKGNEDVTLTFKEFGTGFDPEGRNSTYTCTLEVAYFQPNDASSGWEILPSGENIPYNPDTGCSAIVPKQTRGVILNWSMKATVVDQNDPTNRTFEFYDGLAFRFSGFGA